MTCVCLVVGMGRGAEPGGVEDDRHTTVEALADRSHTQSVSVGDAHVVEDLIVVDRSSCQQQLSVV